MNSFYAEQKGLFTFYIEQEDEMERMRRHKAEEPNPEQPTTITNKRKRGKKRLQASTSKLHQQLEPDQKARLITNVHSLEKSHRQPSLELRKHEEFAVQEDKQQIFHRRKDRQKTKVMQSVQYRVVEQRPGIVPEMMPVGESSQTVMVKASPSLKRLRLLEKQKVSYNRKCFLPMIGTSRLHPSRTKDHSPHISRHDQANQQQSAMELVMGLLNIQSSRMNPIRNLSDAELRSRPVEQVLSHIELPRKDDPYKEIARWRQLRKEVAKRYHYPL